MRFMADDWKQLTLKVADALFHANEHIVTLERERKAERKSMAALLNELQNSKLPDGEPTSK